VLLTLDPKFQDRAMASLKGLPEVSSCYTVSGVYDAVALVRASTASHLDEVLTRIGRLPGITRTTSAILLSTMFERG
jgi:DNA-binding Lrp family transcriptional regulator